MTECSRLSPKSAMKVVMNSKVIMVTVEHKFSDVRLLLTKTSENLSLTISESKSGRKSSKDAKLRSGEWFTSRNLEGIN